MDIYGEFIHLARLAVSGRQGDIQALLRRTARAADQERPDFQDQLKSLLKRLPDSEGGQPYRRAPVDRRTGAQSDLDSLLVEDSAAVAEPTWTPEVKEALDEVIAERSKIDALRAAGVHPTRSLLLVGPPGVGKTMAARWLARHVNRKLYTVDLASIMSSYLGRSGANLQKVLSAAANDTSVLFLDEFDSVAKRRGDETDIGELKRLVNVLLQSIDNWPESGLLLGATNHPELLDRAIWRRFDRVVEFPMPTRDEIAIFTSRKIEGAGFEPSNEMIAILAVGLEGRSFADIEIWLNEAVRSSVVRDIRLDVILAEKIARLFSNRPVSERAKVATTLINAGVSQRAAANLLEVSRDTIRKYAKKS